MNHAPVEPRPVAPQPACRDDIRPPSKANEAQRRAFEKLLSDDEETEPNADACADWGLAPPLLSLKDDSVVPGDQLVPAPIGSAETSAMVSEAPADIAVPAPCFPPAPVQQAGLYTHLALPHGQAAEMGRFEVIDGSMVSRVDVNTNAQGGMTVTVGTSVQHASLLDRYLPQLQRRLPEKVSAHVRVQERDRRRD